MPEMVEVVKKQDERSVLFGYAGSATGVTSLTHFRLYFNCTCFNFQLFVFPFVQLYSLDSCPTELFKPQSAHDDRESTQVCSRFWLARTKRRGREWVVSTNSRLTFLEVCCAPSSRHSSSSSGVSSPLSTDQSSWYRASFHHVIFLHWPRRGLELRVLESLAGWRSRCNMNPTWSDYQLQFYRDAPWHFANEVPISAMNRHSHPFAVLPFFPSHTPYSSVRESRCPCTFPHWLLGWRRTFDLEYAPHHHFVWV